MKVEDLIQEIIERQMELGICHKSGDRFNQGRVEGLEDALGIVTKYLHEVRTSEQKETNK